MEAWKKFELLINNLGETQVLTEVENFFTEDALNDFCESVANSYDIELENLEK